MEYIDGYIEGKEIEVDCSKKDIYLKVNVNYLTRAFYFSYDGEEYQHVDTLTNVYYLCDEGLKKGKRFTGAMVGMYAYDGGFALDYINKNGGTAPDTIYGAFDYFDYRRDI